MQNTPMGLSYVRLSKNVEAVLVVKPIIKIFYRHRVLWGFIRHYSLQKKVITFQFKHWPCKICKYYIQGVGFIDWMLPQRLYSAFNFLIYM